MFFSSSSKGKKCSEHGQYFNLLCRRKKRWNANFTILPHDPKSPAFRSTSNSPGASFARKVALGLLSAVGVGGTTKSFAQARDARRLLFTWTLSAPGPTPPGWRPNARATAKSARTKQRPLRLNKPVFSRTHPFSRRFAKRDDRSKRSLIFTAT